jgi:hypothetical protein
MEVDLDLETVNNEDVITLVTRNEVYYKIYQEAMNKAKEALISILPIDARVIIDIVDNDKKM